MRTHYGLVTTNCTNCQEMYCFLLLPIHAIEGAQCQRCHGLAVPPWKARKLIAEVEETERAAPVQKIEEGEWLTATAER